ncbi:MAG: DUF3343 domain-containing protein [Fusobacterium perfoetens]|uniref:DUF3343 domain-containing protein n=1 Tax=Fusobacterium perfoetens TaxID=852 RepID=UPI0023F2CAF0|nr:DUF3343 domain-containing protein [Fusobacterium perfoetens]MCI6152152.1 DUF3343 domain-containing protein [Fusobacterium perfoetens]MDY3237957.1 DUF3343 domain-containing protein [Fusobacterium perfoetens]
MVLEERFLVVSAESTHLVIKVEKILLNENIECRIIPLPTEISANCGLAVKLEEKYLEKVKEIVNRENLEVKISLVEKKGFKKNIINL